MASPEKSILVVGAGIAGLCLAVVAQARGYAVTVIARDAAADTASGVAAGMIAPAMEALSEADPAVAFRRLKQAQKAWIDLFDLWPEPVQRCVAEGMSHPALYFWDENHQADVWPKLVAMGADCERLDYGALLVEGLDPEEQDAVRVGDEWLVEASTVLASLEAAFEATGMIIRDVATAVTATSATLTGGAILTADHVVIAAGFGARALASSVPSLAPLTPIKGHLLDLPGQGREGVIRSASGYLASYGSRAKFGATMQPGQYDLAIEPDIVDDLKARAAAMSADLPLDAAVARTGIRASTPDGWPLIGRDEASGVWIATGMRRNGFVFAPFAAGVVLDEMEDIQRPDAAIYDPNRFT